MMFKKLVQSRPTSGRSMGDIVAGLKRLLTDEDLDNLSRFAAYQYLRVPGAIEQKTYELQPAEISEAAKDNALNPGRFDENGYDYVRTASKP